MLVLTVIVTVVESTDGVCSLLSSARMSPGEDCPDDRSRGAGPLHQIQGDLPQSAHPAGAGGPPQDLWSVLHISAFIFGSLFPHMNYL